MTTPVKRSEVVQVEGIKRKRGRPKLTWIVVVRKDMSACALIEDAI